MKKLEKKKCMVSLINAEKSLDMYQHPFVLITLSKLEILEKFLKAKLIYKTIDTLKTYNIIFNRQNLKTFPKDQKHSKNVHLVTSI